MSRKWLIVLDITPATLEYFNAARKLGVNTIFITSPSDEIIFVEYLWLKAQAAADEVIITHPCQLVVKIQEFLQQHPGDEIIGGVTPLEYRQIDLEKIHRFLGLSHLYQEKADIISDKYLVRQELKKTGLSNIKSYSAPSPDNLNTWLNDFNRYPCVLKPNHGFSSLFVKVARNVNELRSAIEGSYSVTENPIYRTLLGEQVPFFIEDYIPGSMFSFEGLMVDGHLYSWGIATRAPVQ